MDKWTVQVSLSYETLYFEFDTAEKAATFADIAFRHIVREENSKGELRDVTVTIKSCLTTENKEEN